VAGRAAVFVDRDDTLNKDCPYCARPEDIVLLPTVAEGVRRLNDAALPVVVITNQSGIGRGLFTEADLEAMHAKMQADLRAQTGARLDALYYCPHRPDAQCPDRKPSPGLLLRAARDLGLDLGRCAVIGDRGLDMEVARRVGALAVMVPSARGRVEMAALAQPPDLVAPDFAAAAAWVVERLGPRSGA
jgi:histidinol-phosphate phosphatase family protein